MEKLVRQHSHNNDGDDNDEGHKPSVLLRPQQKNKKIQYKMVALDLDGTLLTPDHTISDATAEYLRYLHNRDFIVSIATGRSASCTFDQISQLNLPRSIPVVCFNGAKGMKVKVRTENEENKTATTADSNNNDNSSSNTHEHKDCNGKPIMLDIIDLFHHPLSMESAKKLISITKDLGCALQYYVGNDIYACPGSTQNGRMLITRYRELTGCNQIICESDFEKAIARGEPSKMLVLCDTLVIDKTFDVIAQSFSSTANAEANVIRGSPPWFVEVLNPKVCKGDGLSIMAQTCLGVDLENVIAFGDGDNDLEFLQMAGKGIAMKNARENVKAIADDITEFTNAEEGVMRKLKAMEQAGLLELK